ELTLGKRAEALYLLGCSRGRASGHLFEQRIENIDRPIRDWSARLGVRRELLLARDEVVDQVLRCLHRRERGERRPKVGCCERSRKLARQFPDANVGGFVAKAALLGSALPQPRALEVIVAS